MSTMNVSLPAAMKDFVDAQVDTGAYGSASEYVRDLIRRDQERRALRAALLEGATSPMAREPDAAWFRGLRARARAKGA